MKKGWSKLPDEKVMWSDEKIGVIEVYDESGLRRCMRGYLTDESRARFGGNNFSTEQCFLKGLEHLTEGLKTLLANP